MKDFKYLDVIDLPSDPSGTLGKFRTGLLQAYNTNRDNIDKLKLLRTTLVTVIQYIETGLTASDSITTEVFRKYQIDLETADTPPTKGSEPIKPKRAARRTPTKRAKRTK